MGHADADLTCIISTKIETEHTGSDGLPLSRRRQKSLGGKTKRHGPSTVPVPYGFRRSMCSQTPKEAFWPPQLANANYIKTALRWLLLRRWLRSRADIYFMIVGFPSFADYCGPDRIRHRSNDAGSPCSYVLYIMLRGMGIVHSPGSHIPRSGKEG